MNASQGFESRSTPLASTSLKVVITDLLAEYELRHTFSNKSRSAIEAIYSFPVPLDAAFLGMEATLAGETLVAQVLSKQRASANYDDAIASGDSAVLLERVEPGMLCVNLGNLKPGETGEIVLRFAAALGVADRQARFSLPLVHRPRYGRYRLEEWAVPEADFAVEHPLTAEIRIRGMLEGRPVHCATQGVIFESGINETVLRVPDGMLDRDLVLRFDLSEAPLSGVRWIKDGEGSIAILTIAPGAGPQTGRGMMDMCLVLDCSGSMRGDAIRQSRDALHAVSRALAPSDRIQVLRFGSRLERLFRRPLRASNQVTEAMRELGDVVQADLGGTEMDTALATAIQELDVVDGAPSSKVILLVTDGAVQPEELEQASERAAAKGVRIFVVAVGSSAGVDALTPLAETTGGVMERAVPTESIDACVMRHVRRSCQPNPLEFAVHWNGPVISATKPSPIYEGDVSMTVAFLADQVPGSVTLRVPGQDTETSHAFSELETAHGWRAWAGQRAYLDSEPDQRGSIALRYQLITEMTSAVLVKRRTEGDRVTELPTVVPVKHMVPDGMVAAPRSISMAMFHSPSSARPVVHALACRELPYDDCPGEILIKDDALGGNPLSRHEESLAKRHLRAGLERVIFGAEPSDDITLESVIFAVDSAFQPLVRKYVKWTALRINGLRDAAKALQDLADEGVGTALTDDQEARIAVLRQGRTERYRQAH